MVVKQNDVGGLVIGWWPSQIRSEMCWIWTVYRGFWRRINSYKINFPISESYRGSYRVNKKCRSHKRLRRFIHCAITSAYLQQIPVPDPSSNNDLSLSPYQMSPCLSTFIYIQSKKYHLHSKSSHYVISKSFNLGLIPYDGLVLTAFIISYFFTRVCVLLSHACLCIAFYYRTLRVFRFPPIFWCFTFRYSYSSEYTIKIYRIWCRAYAYYIVLYRF